MKYVLPICLNEYRYMYIVGLKRSHNVHDRYHKNSELEASIVNEFTLL